MKKHYNFDDPNDVNDFVDILLQENPILWADVERYVRTSMDKINAFPELGITREGMMINIIRRIQQIKQENVKHAYDALEAYFKYGNQKMKVRQELRNNPLKNMDKYAIAKIVGGKESSEGKILYDTFKYRWEVDPEDWRPEGVK